MEQMASVSARTDPHRHWNSDRNICNKGTKGRGCAAGSRGGSSFIIFVLRLILIIRPGAYGLNVVVGDNALGPGQSVVGFGFEKAATGLSICRSSLLSATTSTPTGTLARTFRGCRVRVFGLGHVAVMRCVTTKSEEN
jgi:hypothetical protein